jgi:hypothetical protein
MGVAVCVLVSRQQLPVLSRHELCTSHVMATLFPCSCSCHVGSQLQNVCPADPPCLPLPLCAAPPPSPRAPHHWQI